MTIKLAAILHPIVITRHDRVIQCDKDHPFGASISVQHPHLVAHLDTHHVAADGERAVVIGAGAAQ